MAFMFMGSYAQTEIKSRLDRVTIYQDRALVEKSIKVNLQKGENKFIITGNAQVVQAMNVHFSSSEDWFISSLNSLKKSIPEKEMVKALLPANAYQQYLAFKTKNDRLQEEINDNALQIQTLMAQKTALGNMKAIANTSAIDTVATIKSQFLFQREEMKNINRMLSEANERQQEMYFQKSKVVQDMESLIKKYTGGKNVLTSDNVLEVSLYANMPKQDEEIKYSYLVYGVSSVYNYDVMLDDEKKSAVFSLKNSVSQNTGENWKDCEIVFSTSKGDYVGYDAELYPYYLDYSQNNPYQTKDVKLSRNALVAKEYAGEDAVSLNDVEVFSGSIKNNLTLSKEYMLNTPQCIASGEQAVTIPLYNEKTKAYFTRFSTPKNEEKVFYTALLPDWEDLGLLEVACDVYLMGRFISKSVINTTTMGDTMRFAVGDDKNIKVSRKIRKTSPTEKGFLSKEVVETANISLIIKNTKNEAVELGIKDQIPISANTEIKVSDVELAGGELNANTGVVRWNVSLAPKEEKTITFSYTVKYPKGNRVILN